MKRVMTRSEIFERMDFYNEKAERLRKMKFVLLAMEQPSGLRLSWKVGESIQAIRTGPDWEEIDAFVLTFRFFIEDKDGLSFHRMSEIYKQSVLEEQGRKHFGAIAKEYGRLLKSHSPVAVNGKHLTFEQIMKVFIYGGLSHANADKKKIYDQWMSQEPLKTVMENEFVFAVREVMGLIWQVRNLNYIVNNRSNAGLW